MPEYRRLSSRRRAWEAQLTWMGVAREGTVSSFYFLYLFASVLGMWRWGTVRNFGTSSQVSLLKST
jgi:hypothetical protein